MEHFVTLFDSLFLPQGLALHMSMQRRLRGYRLWVLCVDDLTYDVLATLALPNVCLLRLTTVETPELLAAKQGRSKGEYCWTLTPFAPRFVFEADPSARRVTYLDADLWILKDVAPLFAELDASGAGVLITDHGYAPEHDQTFLSGQYCVQFMTFDRVRGETVRKWWEERCIEWCYDRFEEGRFGDQKYLDDWPERFAGQVHVLQQQQLAQAPWNATRYPYGQAAFYHFQGLRIARARRFYLGPYPLPLPLLRHVYDPYLADLSAAIHTLAAIGFRARPQGRHPGLLVSMRRLVARTRQQLWRFYQLQLRRY